MLIDEVRMNEPSLNYPNSDFASLDLSLKLTVVKGTTEMIMLNELRVTSSEAATSWHSDLNVREFSRLCCSCEIFPAN
jgi:hypothetical protein